MTELRKNLITDDWVIIAKERSKRPCEFTYKKNKKENTLKFNENCPFCPGNEKFTSEEILVYKDKLNKWKYRVVANKYPALNSSIQLNHENNNLFYKISGYGFHEVVIENKSHNIEPSFYDENDFVNILDIYKKRYLKLSKHKNIKTIVIFKNHGKNAGTSLEHPHSQIVAMPFIPKLIHQRINIAAKFYKKRKKCIFCENYKQELKDNKRIILESKYFVSFIPYAALSPYHLWIIPKKHSPSFGNITKFEIKDLSNMILIILKKLYKGLSNPDYNLIIRSVLNNMNNSEYFHWYISIIPRINKSAGFELSSGTFINPSLPEESATFLKNIKPN